MQIKNLLILIVVIVFTSCTERFALPSGSFQDVLVIEGTITNELKNQEIKVSRSVPIDVQLQNIVNNATVQVLDDTGITYDFAINGNSYKSITAFQAQSGKKYKLVVAINGQIYESNLQAVPDVAPLQEVTASAITKNNGSRGVSIKVSSDNSNGNSQYYRYAYEETFVVKPPKWVEEDVNYDDATDTFFLTPRPFITSVGYLSNISTEIITTTTLNLAENIINNFEAVFIPNNNYKISYRYSLMCKQYLINQDAYFYFNQIKISQNSEGAQLSPIQPGFISSNIKNTTNFNEKIAGFFDVATVSEKRIFFNYSDLFPGEEIPPYFTDCSPRIFDFTMNSDPTVKDVFIKLIADKQGIYFSGGGILWQTVIPACGDASYFASLIKPSFWID